MILLGCKYRPSERITYKSWHPETINRDIISGDIVFIGADPDAYLSKFKSNNRALTGWALNMPVAYDLLDLKRLLGRGDRITDVKKGHRLVREKYDIRHSVYEYDHIIRKIINRRIYENLNDK